MNALLALSVSDTPTAPQAAVSAPVQVYENKGEAKSFADDFDAAPTAPEAVEPPPAQVPRRVAPEPANQSRRAAAALFDGVSEAAMAAMIPPQEAAPEVDPTALEAAFAEGAVAGDSGAKDALAENTFAPASPDGAEADPAPQAALTPAPAVPAEDVAAPTESQDIALDLDAPRAQARPQAETPRAAMASPQVAAEPQAPRAALSEAALPAQGRTAEVQPAAPTQTDAPVEAMTDAPVQQPRAQAPRAAEQAAPAAPAPDVDGERVAPTPAAETIEVAQEASPEKSPDQTQPPRAAAAPAARPAAPAPVQPSPDAPEPEIRLGPEAGPRTRQTAQTPEAPRSVAASAPAQAPAEPAAFDPAIAETAQLETARAEHVERRETASAPGGVREAAAPNAARAMAQAVVMARPGDDRVELRLDPPELGKVAIDMRFDSQGALHAVVSADRQDTQDMLRRNAEMLQKELADAGYEDAQLDFSGRDAESGAFGGQDEQGAQDESGLQSRAGLARAVENTQPAGGARSAAADGRLDIRM